MKKNVFFCFLIALFFAMTIPVQTIAQSKSRTSKTGKPKTVRVKSYRTKSGKQVKAHYRSKPSKKSTRRKTSYIIIPDQKYYDRPLAAAVPMP